MTLTGTLFNIQHFSVHDGPGIRTTVFFKGCNLHCWWCHNPESWHGAPELQVFASKCIGCGDCVKVCPRASAKASAIFTEDCLKCGKCAEACFAEATQIVGKQYTAEAVMQDILQDRDAYEMSGGGVTFTGGEPLLQSVFLLKLLTECKAAGIHTAIETAACVPADTLGNALPFLNLVYCDIKNLNSVEHKNATGQPNERILDNIRMMSKSGVELRLRTPIIPGFNDDVAHIKAIAHFVAELPSHPTLELLPFHGICSGKYEALHRKWKGAGLREPSAELMNTLRAVVKEAGVSL